MKDETVFDKVFQTAGKMYDVDWRLLKAQVKQESAFNPLAKSAVGAKGLAQFMPATWAEWGDGDIFDPVENIHAQARYMNSLLHMYSGNISLALAAYNWGMGNLAKLFKRKLTKDFGALYPFMPKETQTYVDHITKYLAEYKAEKPV